MRNGILYVLMCLSLGGCAAHSARCDGPLLPINAAAASPDGEARPQTNDPAVMP